ncbi:hypothetical protein MPNT_280008 [Candidatus Methylacidithermus pantelleriae]|uniref:Uncharacterized protein n=1 Tax=Candidatus Methylacidithermus pantelleriae TaxID=2744239 RepID=A0A8J2FSF7_9BACT|nr:hypothetical protein MPNT_280008 [Candidatus Methylacidithermus pantelleriae]
MRGQRSPGRSTESAKELVIERLDLRKRKARAGVGGSRSGPLALFLRLR